MCITHVCASVPRAAGSIDKILRFCVEAFQVSLNGDMLHDSKGWRQSWNHLRDFLTSCFQKQASNKLLLLSVVALTLESRCLRPPRITQREPLRQLYVEEACAPITALPAIVLPESTKCRRPVMTWHSRSKGSQASRVVSSGRNSAGATVLWPLANKHPESRGQIVKSMRK